jgi:hypothetical protein
VEEIGNHFEGGGRSGSPLSYEAPVFEPPLKDSGRGRKRRVRGQRASRPTVNECSPL